METGEPRLTYEQRRKELQDKRISEYKEKRKELEHAVAHVAAIPEGRAVLHWLMRECGFLQASTRLGTDGEIQCIGTVYNEARRNLWLDLRRSIPSDSLALIETYEVTDDER